MSSASLVHTHHSQSRHTQQRSTHPDAVRIAALSAAMALNLAVLMMATRPAATPFVHAIAQPVPATLIRWITPPAVVPPPPAIVMRPLPHPPKAVPHSQPKLQPLVVPSVMTTTEGRLAAPPATVTTITPKAVVSAPAVNTSPVEASLAYRSSPLQFPVQAMRQQMHGTVLLRVLVDETGKPLDVVLEKSSGYTLVDRSAREQVLASWKFQPAMVDGKAVRAWARVPVSFNLSQQ